MKKIRLAVLISGSGTTLRNLIEQGKAGKLRADIVLVISSLGKSSQNAEILNLCETLQVPVKFLNPKNFQCREEFWLEQTRIIDEFTPDLIALAGYLKFWQIPEKYMGKVMNIHPALLPAFGGKGFYGQKVHQAVLNSDAKESGCTVHFANNNFDAGPIILQRKTKILPGDTPQSLQKRVFEQECQAYPAAINLFAQNRLKIHGNADSGTVEIVAD